MKKTIFLFLFFLLNGALAIASHIYGGEMIYEYVSSSANSKRYRITLKLFRDNNGGGAALPASVFIGVFDYGTKKHVPATQSHYEVSLTSGPTPVNINVSPCATGDITGNYSVASYSFEVDLPNNEDGYIASYETCCRVNGLANVFHPGTPGGGTGGTGSTYVTRIPGNKQLPTALNNSSPQFVTSLDLVCKERPFTWNFSATDPDAGDELVYSFAPAYDKSIATSANNVAPAPPNAAGAPDYPEVQYINGYTAMQPLGPNASINSKTGVISGIAPPVGKYVVSVLVKEYRTGILISEHRKDFILRVQDCDIAAARLLPSYNSCDGFSFTFSNEAGASPLIHTYYWDFGDGKNSVQEKPTHTYADTGVYKIKLVVNRGEACADSATSVIKVFPGFFPNFTFFGVCVNKPTQFKDSTKTAYGVVNSWSWNFGDATSAADTSRAQNPVWTFTQLGSKAVSLIVTNSKGCIDTITKTVNIIDKPPLSVAFKDTTICKGDAVQLKAIGDGSFTWTPSTEITGGNTDAPTVSPSVTRTYTVELSQQGCLAYDSIKVKVINAITVQAMNDTTICFTDSVQLSATTNGLKYEWTLAAGIANPTLLRTRALPSKAGLNTYNIRVYLGGCVPADDQVVVNAVPYPVVTVAADDDTICFNASTTLRGTTDGTNFVWSPAIGLSNPNSLDPVASPPNTTSYVLTVTNPASGCPKPSSDSLVLTVLPQIFPFAGNDTAVIAGEPLQFNATGGIRYQWTPATNLSADNIPNPVGLYRGEYDSIRYQVDVFNENNCVDSDYITVKIFRTTPQIFVPTAFTPNRDGRNDRIRPIAVGIKKIDYFRVYNRWGQLVFQTTRNGEGWDGRIGGKDQGTAVFVWIVKAVDYLGNEFIAKGTVTLIR